VTTPLTVAVTGASGFVGGAFCEAHRDRYTLVGLSRSERAAKPGHGPHSWRACDLYSQRQTEQALAGVDVAVYLVHSMMPTDRLTQASFADLDLILADNFGLAAARAGVKKIVYLGGIIPQGVDELSPHLASRREVEHALAAHGVPVTTLRAGLVVGAQGSSFQILRRLVERLPAMLCPRWTRTATQPVALPDVVELLQQVIDRDEFDGGTWDIGGPDVVTYRQMIADLAELTCRRRMLLPAPLFSPRLSRLWVSLVTGTSRALVGPLVESLRHPMVAANRDLQDAVGQAGTPWRTMLAAALSETVPTARRSKPSRSARSAIRRNSRVRSVQRLTRPPGASAHDIAHAYVDWLPRFCWPWMRVRTHAHHVSFHLRPLSAPLLDLELAEDRSTADRTLFRVVGGLLVAPTARPGRLEFRIAPDGEHVLAAVHDFRPRLPWYLYVLTQAKAHLLVMWGFDRYLRRQAEGGPLVGPPTTKKPDLGEVGLP
jgi:uncharacterized protein YbjT (DUF2867 family)